MQEVTCENVISILELLCLFMAMNIAKFEASRASLYCSYMLLYSKTTIIFLVFFSFVLLEHEVFYSSVTRKECLRKT